MHYASILLIILFVFIFILINLIRLEGVTWHAGCFLKYTRYWHYCR